VSRDVLRLAHFYGNLLGGSVDGNEIFAFVHMPGALLSVFHLDGMDQMAPGSMTAAGNGAVLLEFQVEDVDRHHSTLPPGSNLVVKPPTTQPWGRRSLWLRDPDGNIVNLFQPVRPRPDPEEVVRRYFARLFHERDTAVCDELLAADYVDHDAPATTPPGPMATKEYVTHLLHDVPDLVLDLHEVNVDGMAVTVRATWHGTHRTGIPWAQSGLVLIHVNDAGQLVERWSAYIPAVVPQS
jgi:predicted enzyme related to lactoylglutathione lyase/ketosteroid isomerase-like protein